MITTIMACTVTGDEVGAMPSARATGPSETWASIPGYEGLYQVSNAGSVLSVRTNQLRALTPDSCGYLTVRLAKNGSQRRYSVHRLVCAAFNRAPSDGQFQVAHLDGNPANNRADNLTWASPRENCAHKVGHGTRQSGTRNGRAKFSDDLVARVRLMKLQGYSNVRVAEATGVSPTHVQRIASGETRHG